MEYTEDNPVRGMLLSLLHQTFQPTNQIPIDLDHVERVPLKIYGARYPKGVEMNESMLAILPYWGLKGRGGPEIGCLDLQGTWCLHMQSLFI